MVSTSLFTGLTGLRSHETFLEVVGNNLANVNTPGFWSSRATFADLLSVTIAGGNPPSSNLGGVNPMQVGIGTLIAGIDADSRQGAFQDTGRPFDVAIDGKGFFALSDGTRSYYTRVGSFALDSSRGLVDARTGLRVQSSTGGDITIPSDATLPGTSTTTIDFDGILPARVTGPVPEVLGSASPFKEGTAATKNGTLSFPANLSGESGNSFTVAVDGGSRQTVDITATEFGGNLASVSFAQFKSGLEAQARGVTVVQTGSGFRIVTDSVGDAATLRLDNGTGTPLTALGLDSTLVTGTEQPAAASTALGSLVGNTKDYVAGDRIQVAGKHPNGQPLAGTFTFGANGTTLGDLVNYVQSLYTDATVALGTDGRLTVTSNTTGEATLELSITDDASSTGKTSFTGFTVSQQGRGPDTATTSINVFDSLGRSHPVTMKFQRNTNGTWDLTATMDAAEGTVTQGTVSGITFNADGSFDRVAGGSSALGFAFANGASAQTISLDLGTQGKFDGLSMVGDETTAAATGQDGYGAGELIDVAIDVQGQVKGLYSNGQTSVIDQLRIAMFSNPDGLLRSGDTLFVESANSGAAILTTATAGGAGVIESGMLEGSNVDMAEQFVKLIEGQRGFQASARVISTADEILAEVMNLVR